MSHTGDYSPIEAGMFSLPLSINQQFFDKDVASTFVNQHQAYLLEQLDRPHRFAIRNFLSVFHFRLGNIFKACEYFKKTLEEDRSNVNALSDLAYIYQKLYQHTEAEKLLNELEEIAKLPKNSDDSDRKSFLERKSRCIAEIGYIYAYDISKSTLSIEIPNQAVDKYSQAIKLAEGTGVDENEIQDWKFYRGLMYKSMYNIHMDLNTGNFETVENFYEMAAEDFEANKNASNIHRQADAYSNHGSLMAKYCSRGICRHDDKKHCECRKDKDFHGQATEDCETSMASSKKRINYHDKRDRVKKETCNCRNKVKNLFKRALQIDQGNIRTHVRYGRELTYCRDFEGALLTLNQAIVLDESSANWFAYSSRALVHLHKYNRVKDRGYLLLAEADLLKSVHGNPSPIDFGRLGYVYHLLGSHEHISNTGEYGDQNTSKDHDQYLLKALHYFMNATEITDGNLRSDIHFNRGKCLLDMKEKRGAVESFKKALECEPPNCKTLKHCESLILSLFDLYHLVEKDKRKEILAELCFWWREGFKCKSVKNCVNKKKNSSTMLKLLEELLKYQDSDFDQSVKTSLIQILSENTHKKKQVENLLAQYPQDNISTTAPKHTKKAATSSSSGTISDASTASAAADDDKVASAARDVADDDNVVSLADCINNAISDETAASHSNEHVTTGASIAGNTNTNFATGATATTNSDDLVSAGDGSAVVPYKTIASDAKDHVPTANTEADDSKAASSINANSTAFDHNTVGDTVTSDSGDHVTGGEGSAAGDGSVAGDDSTAATTGYDNNVSVSLSTTSDNDIIVKCDSFKPEDSFTAPSTRPKYLRRSKSCIAITICDNGLSMSPVQGHPSKTIQEPKSCTIADVVLYICEQLDVENITYGCTVPNPPISSKCRQFKYDFFVVFSEKQKEWVFYSLLARLEQTYKFKGCIPNRDFTPGKPVCENIKDSVMCSACTMVVIDKDFCNDQVLRHRLTYAYYENARLKKLLIPILKEKSDVPMEICNLTPVNATTTINMSKLARDIEIASMEDRSTGADQTTTCSRPSSNLKYAT